MKKNLIVVLPAQWQIGRIRYLQLPEAEPAILDADKLDTPLDDPDSILNKKSFPIKRETKVQLCTVDGCEEIAVWEHEGEYLCGKHMR